MRIRATIGLFVFTTAVFGQVQRGRVATDYHGRIVLFETDSASAGESAAPVERILESGLGEVAVTAASPLDILHGGVASPRTDDSGALRAYSYYRRGISTPIGGARPPEFTGVVRHDSDGWELRYPGRAGLSRSGRWAAFAGAYPSQTLWVDLWTGAESVLRGAVLNVDAVADDGALATASYRSLLVHQPQAEPRSFPLPFEAFGALIDRHSACAVVSGSNTLWKVDLGSGEAAPLVRQCDSCRLLDVAPSCSAVLYTQWSVLYVASGEGTIPRRLTGDGQLADSAVFDGTATQVIASTLDGVMRLQSGGGDEEVLVPGPSAFSQMPKVLAPGMWLKTAGRGLSKVEIRLNGQMIEPLRRTPGEVVWVVPPETPAGPATLEAGQAGSPFEPAKETVEVQLAAPAFISQGAAGLGNTTTADWPVILHADSNRTVTWTDPARPGEKITVLMTGLNGQGDSIEWLLSRPNVDEFVRPVFESAGPYPANPHWSVVQLRMPQTLQRAMSALGAVYGNARNGILIATSNE